MAMSRREVYALRVRLARCALGMSVRGFAKFVALAPNTICNVENAKPTLGRVYAAIEEKLSTVSALKWFPDDGKSIGVRLYYAKMSNTDALGQKNPEKFPPPIQPSSGFITLYSKDVDRIWFGENPVLVCREALKLTREELARKAGISVVYLFEVELGKRTPTPRVMSTLAQAMRIERTVLTRKYPPVRDVRREYDPNETE